MSLKFHQTNVVTVQLYQTGSTYWSPMSLKFHQTNVVTVQLYQTDSTYWSPMSLKFHQTNVVTVQLYQTDSTYWSPMSLKFHQTNVVTVQLYQTGSTYWSPMSWITAHSMVSRHFRVNRRKLGDFLNPKLAQKNVLFICDVHSIWSVPYLVLEVLSFRNQSHLCHQHPWLHTALHGHQWQHHGNGIRYVSCERNDSKMT